MDDLTKMVSISMDTGAVKKMANAEHFLGYAEKIIVTNDHDYEQAADLIGDIASRIKKFDDMRKQLKAPVLEAGRNIDNLFREPIDQGVAAKKILESKMLDYLAVVDKRRQEEQAQADKRAAEQKKKAEAEALTLMEAGDDEGAQEVLDNVDLMPEPLPLATTPKAKGIGTRANWKARIIDLHRLVKAVSCGVAPITLLMVDTSAANKYAKAVRDTLTVPGLEFYNDASLTVRKTKNETTF